MVQLALACCAGLCLRSSALGRFIVACARDDIAMGQHTNTHHETGSYGFDQTYKGFRLGDRPAAAQVASGPRPMNWTQRGTRPRSRLGSGGAAGRTRSPKFCSPRDFHHAGQLWGPLIWRSRESEIVMANQASWACSLRARGANEEIPPRPLGGDRRQRGQQRWA